MLPPPPVLCFPGEGCCSSWRQLCPLPLQSQRLPCWRGPGEGEFIAQPLQRGSQRRELWALPGETQIHPRALGVGESLTDAGGKGMFLRLVVEEENSKRFPGALGAGKENLG